MALDFVILLDSKELESEAYEIENKIKSVCSKDIFVEVITDCSSSLYSNIVKFKEQQRHIIVVDNDYIENNKVSIRFFDENSKASFVTLEQLLVLIVSLETNTNPTANATKYKATKANTTKDNAIKYTNNNIKRDQNNWGCPVM